MASPVIQFKRGNLADLPGLRAGEPGFTVDKYDLYVGIDSTTSNNKFVGSGRYWQVNTTSVGSGVKLVEGTDNGTSAVILKSPNSLAADVTYTLPGAAVNNGIMVSDASGNLSLTTTVTGSGSGLSAGSVPLTSVDIDGATASTSVVDADLFVYDDGANGTNRKIVASDMKKYVLRGGLDQSAKLSEIKVSGISTVAFVDSTQLKVSGVSTFTGTVDINGAIDADGGANIAGGETVLSSATISDLTSGRVVIAGTSGVIEDDDNLRFDGSNLFVSGIKISGSGTTLGVDFLTRNAKVSGISTFEGNIDAINGDFDGTLEADAITVAGVALNTVIAGVTVTNSTNAAHVLVTDNESTNEENLITFVEGATSSTGNVGLEMDGNLTYNPSTGSITATGFIGALTGNASGSSGSCTGNAATATALESARTIAGVSFDGTANISLNNNAITNGAGYLTAVATGNIADDAVTYAKIQNVSATNRILGRDSSGAGVIEEITPANLRTMINVEDGADVTDATNVAAAGAVMEGDTTTASMSFVVDEDNMSSDSATKVPTQQSVKAYVDTEVAAVDLATSLAGDSGTGTVSTSQTLTVSGTSNEVETSVSSQTITIGLPASIAVTTSVDVPTVEATNLKARDGTTAITITNSTGAVACAQNLTVGGNLIVNGTTTQVNTTNTTIEDALLEFGMVDGAAPTSDLNKDVGVIFNYYTDAAKKAAMYWDDSASKFVFSAVATESTGVLTNSTAGSLEVGALFVNDCAGNTQLVSCSGTTRSLENISIDGGSF